MIATDTGARYTVTHNGAARATNQKRCMAGRSEKRETAAMPQQNAIIRERMVQQSN
jgi:hypothetical protein